MCKISVIIGTRPEAIKMLPLVKELKKNKNFSVSVCHSGQHTDLAEGLFEFFGIKPDCTFDVMSKGQSLSSLNKRLTYNFDDMFDKEEPRLVLVHGDTTSAFCAALSAFYRGIKIGHVEAGLRTYNKHSPYPEEFNRTAIDAMSDYYFAPTERAGKNLQNEGRGSVFVTGNTVIDALKYTISADFESELLKRARGRKIILITAHRRENVGERMANALLAIREIFERRNDIFAIFPVHPNPEVKSVAEGILENSKNICLCPPLGVAEFHNILSRAYLVLSDSGGIQEEASFLGTPVLLLRDNTERGELVASGNVRLVGTDTEKIRKEFLTLLDNDFEYEKMSRATSICGDGFASRRIVNLLEKLLLK